MLVGVIVLKRRQGKHPHLQVSILLVFFVQKKFFDKELFLESQDFRFVKSLKMEIFFAVFKVQNRTLLILSMPFNNNHETKDSISNLLVILD